MAKPKLPTLDERVTDLEAGIYDLECGAEYELEKDDTFKDEVDYIYGQIDANSDEIKTLLAEDVILHQRIDSVMQIARDGYDRLNIRNSDNDANLNMRLSDHLRKVDERWAALWNGVEAADSTAKWALGIAFLAMLSTVAVAVLMR